MVAGQLCAPTGTSPTEAIFWHHDDLCINDRRSGRGSDHLHPAATASDLPMGSSYHTNIGDVRFTPSAGTDRARDVVERGFSLR